MRDVSRREVSGSKVEVGKASNFTVAAHFSGEAAAVATAEMLVFSDSGMLPTLSVTLSLSLSVRIPRT